MPPSRPLPWAGRRHPGLSITAATAVSAAADHRRWVPTPASRRKSGVPRRPANHAERSDVRTPDGRSVGTSRRRRTGERCRSPGNCSPTAATSGTRPAHAGWQFSSVRMIRAASGFTPGARAGPQCSACCCSSKPGSAWSDAFAEYVSDTPSSSGGPPWGHGHSAPRRTHRRAAEAERVAAPARATHEVRSRKARGVSTSAVPYCGSVKSRVLPVIRTASPTSAVAR